MLKNVVVPDIGAFSDVEIIEVLVKEGQEIAKEASLITLETDKATMEIPSPYSGKIKSLKVKAGDKVSTGNLILEMEVEGAEAGNHKTEPSTAIDKKLEKSESAEQTEKSTGKSSEKFSSEKQTAEQKGKPVPVIQKVVVPDIGAYTGVSIIEVLVKVGDLLRKEDPLITLETDKATMEIPSPFSGVVESLSVKVGDKVSAGDLILSLVMEGEATGKAVVEQPSATTASETQAKPGLETKDAESKKYEQKTEPSRVEVSEKTSEMFKAETGPEGLGRGKLVHAGPGVRRFARELGVDLSRVKGTGRKERILTVDVQQYVKSQLKAIYSGEMGAGRGGAGISGFESLPPWPSIDHSQFGPIQREALPRIKKLSGSYLLRNWVMVPHVTQFDEADITELEQFRKESQSLVDEGVKLTPLAFIMKAVTAALQTFPTFNASLDASGTELTLKQYYHIGVAVDTPNGLVVPVVRDVDKKGIFLLAKELGEISQRARKGQLKAQDMQGSSFSISSLGGIGGTAFTPIINVPDVAILGVSRSSMKPIFSNGQFVPRLMLPLSLSYDHRVIDGAEAARFSSYLVRQLSDIRRLLL